jgi:hypothetical protein
MDEGRYVQLLLLRVGERTELLIAYPLVAALEPEDARLYLTGPITPLEASFGRPALNEASTQAHTTHERECSYHAGDEGPKMGRVVPSVETGVVKGRLSRVHKETRLEEQPDSGKKQQSFRTRSTGSYVQ